MYVYTSAHIYMYLCIVQQLYPVHLLKHDKVFGASQEHSYYLGPISMGVANDKSCCVWGWKHMHVACM